MANGPAFDQFRLHHAMLQHVFPQRCQQIGIFGEAFHQDLARAIERSLGVRHAGVVDIVRGFERRTQIARCLRLRIKRWRAEQGVGQRLEPGFARDLGLGAALLLERQVQVFKPRLVFGGLDAGAQFG